MKPSFWSKRRKNYKELYESSVNGSLSFSEIVEPVPSEFQGKEAIRISCVQKTFRKKGETVEALRNLSFDIYEGQITALLGHSGTGKTTLMNILCGLCPPTDGELLGDQIYPSTSTRVLLLDEPTAGMDPCSRHIVWNLLRNRKANCVTVFSTHFMDEADILADRKAVISQGMLKCLGSSLFLKSKWGIGYRLSMHIDAYCNTEATTSLIRQHIPAASLIQQNDEQLVYTLPLKDMDKFAVQILLFFIHHIIKNSVAAIRLSPDLYLLKPGENYHKYRSRLLLQNSTESDIDDIVRSLGSMNVLLEMFNDSDYVSAAPHSAALNVFDLESRQIFCLIGYVPSVVLFTYVVSFTFRKVQNTKEFWSFIFSVTALLCTVVTEVAFFLDYYLVTTVLHYVFSIFIPIYPLIGSLICFIKVSWKGKRKNGGYYDPWDRLLVAVVAPYLQCVVWLFLLRCFELKNGGRTVREDPFFRKCSTKAKSWKFADVPPDESEDEDVKAERLRVQEILSSPKSEEMPAILVSRLHKEFDERKEFLLGRKIKKVATKHVSLCVKKVKHAFNIEEYSFSQATLEQVR
ncbi:atp-binding cassette sub-family a member 5 [Limosa lapponica baueri]|uniref:Atp-binding cassette sub-family a member 5 n=1 Tax=Limosa lapponica baueri TaxID=1758121 RepID=A0A2I0TCH5_LIMLA|nr:atp-binding cassette sub-family a member 5 [Limosa lapponica baueri]